MDALNKQEKLCRAIVSERCEGNCERCGKGGQVTMHHRKKRGQGGPWDPTNIVGVCGDGTRGCHGWIEAHPMAAAATGWHVRPWDDPGEIAVVPLYGSPRLLAMDGSTRPPDQRKSSLLSNFELIHTDHIDTQDPWET